MYDDPLEIQESFFFNIEKELTFYKKLWGVNLLMGDTVYVCIFWMTVSTWSNFPRHSNWIGYQLI